MSTLSDQVTELSPVTGHVRYSHDRYRSAHTEAAKQAAAQYLSAIKGPITGSDIYNYMSADRDSRALPQILLQSWRAGRLQVEALRYWLPPGWTIATTPHVNLTNEEWLELCNAAGFVSGIGLSMFLEHGFRGGPVAHRLVAAPPHRLTLYRGAPYKYRAGWSWTPDAHTAMRFAAAPKAMNTMHGRGMLWLSVVPAGSILMHIANPSFDEYVVNTAGLDIWPARHVPNWDGP